LFSFLDVVDEVGELLVAERVAQVLPALDEPDLVDERFQAEIGGDLLDSRAIQLLVVGSGPAQNSGRCGGGPPALLELRSW
jgi:hypothetical protein